MIMVSFYVSSLIVTVLTNSQVVLLLLHEISTHAMQYPATGHDPEPHPSISHSQNFIFPSTVHFDISLSCPFRQGLMLVLEMNVLIFYMFRCCRDGEKPLVSF